MEHLLESRIDAVTVHRRGAVVTRVAELPAGRASRVSFGGLPLGIDDGSVRVSVTSANGLEATDLRVALAAPEPDEDLRPARPEDLIAAERQVARLRDERTAIERERARIGTLGVIARPRPAGDQAPSPSPAEARLALLRLRETRIKAADEAHRQNHAALREAGRVLADLKERERRATTMRRTEPHELRKRVDVTLRGERAEGPATVRLEYRTQAARWAPSYALRLDADAGRGTLEVRAVVAQRSGEDWDGVALTLSTATLSGWAELPELPSLRIGRQAPREAKSGWRPPPIGTDALFGDFDRARAEPTYGGGGGVAGQPVSESVDRELAAHGRSESFAFAEAAAEAEPAPEQARRPRPAPPPQSTPMAGAAPAPMAPPASRAMAKVKRKREKRGGGPAPGGAVASKLDLASSGFGGGLAVSDTSTLELEETAEESIDAAMLDYGRLRMLAPTDGARGKLVLRTRRALHLERVTELELSVDVGAAFGAAERLEAQLHGAPLPPGCVAPSPSGFDYAYRASGPLDTASDGAFHNLALARDASETRLRYVVVPRESRDAFRFVEMDNPLDAPLLDGPVDVYVGGDFLLTSRVREVPEGGVLRLGLGVEQRLKVSRNARFTETSGGLMGGRLDLAHEIEVELENLLPREARVEVRERVPTLREDEDDIRVEERDVSPPWETWEPDEQPELDGGRRWEVTVEPGQKTALKAAYEVRIASKHELVGGNRRES